MKSKIALLVVYNHRYDKNIPLIEKIYGSRFSHIYHLVPFYDGESQYNVIPVYESSYYFQGYIAQAYGYLKEDEFTHYYVIADDLILNPVINETNLWDVTGLKIDECLLPEFIVLQKSSEFWSQAAKALKWSAGYPGLEAKVLPSREEALRKFEKFNMPDGPVSSGILGIKENIWRKLFNRNHANKIENRTLHYPLVGGYSDTFLITSDAMRIFANYCGFFATTRLFVEFAVPTAMVLSADKIKLEKDIKFTGWPIWNKEQIEGFEEQYHSDLIYLMNNFPHNVLYIHPIKLSKWKI